LKTTGLKNYETEAATLLNKNGKKTIPRLPVEKLIQESLSTSMPSATNSKNYYIANVTSFLTVLPLLINKLHSHLEKYTPTSKDLLIFNHYHSLRRILFDGILILREIEMDLHKKKISRFHLGKYPVIHQLDYLITVDQLIFGQRSFNSKWDTTPEFSAAIIRMMIEVRLRLLTGIVGSVNIKTNAIEPLTMRPIFNALEKTKNDYHLTVSISTLQRIYTWANIFLHSSFKPYMWQPILIRKCLSQFIAGPQSSRRSKKNNKVFFSKKTMLKVQGIVRAGIQKNPDFDMLTW